MQARRWERVWTLRQQARCCSERNGLHDFHGTSAGVVIHDYTAQLQNTDTVRAALIFKFN